MSHPDSSIPLQDRISYLEKRVNTLEELYTVVAGVVFFLFIIAILHK